MLYTGGREEKKYVYTDLDHKKDRYLCQIVPFNEQSSYYVFFSTLKFMKKIYLSLDKFFVSN